ncbi:MAG: GNAT family N-acetyltransferase [Desulfuromonadales bacterium]|nr:GNAT family N-acetyltransferase [Desulfuromonadales bacterium]
MILPASVRETPWDKNVFGLNTFEILTFDSPARDFVKTTPGHFTTKVDPLSDCRPLVQGGFYYCDTLIEPYATKDMATLYEDQRAGICDVNMEELTPICLGAFEHGRFHRDRNLDRSAADRRYLQWLAQMHSEGGVFGLTWEGVLAAFFACSESRILLHAVAEPYRGKGLAKFLWSAAILELFKHGYDELSSSISTANLAVLNLYSSLGFRFRNAIDVYHMLTP